MDKLIVKGLGKRLDGEYDCDIRALVVPGSPDSLTYREGRMVKEMTGMRGREIIQAFLADDPDVEIALATVILARHGKTLDEELVLDSPSGSKLQFEYGEVEEDEDDPPAEPAETPETEKPEKPSTSGGESTTLTLAHSENGQSPTGVPDSQTSAVFDRLTSAT